MGARIVYVAIAKPLRAFVSGDSTPPEMLPTMTVHIGEDAPQDTGLLTADGTRIYRAIQRAPLGFCRDG